MSTRLHLSMKPAAAPVRSLGHAPLRSLQRKCSCGGAGGKCDACKKKEATLQRSPAQPLSAPAQKSFNPLRGHDFSRMRILANAGAHESGSFVPTLIRTPHPGFLSGIDERLQDELQPGQVPADAGHAKPQEKKARGCKEICDDAYKDPALNGAGGGVICDGATKCACTFDIPVGTGIKRGECPEIDSIAAKHEARHLPDVDCDASKGLHRPPFRDQSKANASECTHRKETSDELSEAMKKAAEPCKTKMGDLKSVLDTWVKANCGAH